MTPSSLSSKLQSVVAKTLGINTDDDIDVAEDGIRDASLLPETPEAFIDGPPTAGEWLQEQIPSRDETADYIRSLFPFLNWIGHYNLQWLASDLVAGITIGAVVVPQGMAYALLAKVEPQYGLFSSFVGVMLYWIFGTSKDISIGPVAVLSTIVGNVVEAVGASGRELAPHAIASALSIVSGAVVLAIGLLRCGWIVDLISIPCLSAFMTGSAITIASSQLPALLGITGFSNRAAPYRVVINTVKHLSEASLDAVLGLAALAILYLIRHGLTQAAERIPKRRRLIFFINTMRTVVVIVCFTFVSYLVNVDRREDPAFRVLGYIPQGFGQVGVPHIDADLVRRFAPYLPATVIVMLVEHVAIAKSFGRVNNYTIDPSQEMAAIGVTNLVGPFLGGYPSTGSFSRTAIKSKAGVRTPAAGIFVGLVVLLATYFLTGIFFYIPSASLAAVIIHAVGDLITPPSTAYQFWRVSPVEFIVFVVGVLVSVFVHIEDGLYTTVGLSAAILIYRLLKAKGRFLGKVKVHSVLGDHIIGDDHREVIGQYGTFQASGGNAVRNVFLPMDYGASEPSPHLTIGCPHPGIFIYRFSEGFNYPNANASLEYLVDFVYANTTRTSPEYYERPGDRPWNNPGPRRSSKAKHISQPADELPTLKAMILDFSSVNNVDITSVQRLIDIRNQLDMYASPDTVDWHIACINNKWTKRALIAGGFGVPTKANDGLHHRWRSIFSVAEIGGQDSAAAVAEEVANAQELWLASQDEEQGAGLHSPEEDEPLLATPSTGGEKLAPGPSTTRRKGVLVSSSRRPLFHIDLTSAVQGAIANAEARHEFRFETASSDEN
jgi:solute carrier family 26 (sodium-independent sulfate anion transporter), member 11